MRLYRASSQELLLLYALSSPDGVRRLTTASKRKGDGFERELAAYINEATGLSSFRAPLSGGGTIEYSGGADLVGTPNLFIEAKRVEKLNFHAALAQAEKSISKTGCPDMAVVVNRRNRQTTGQSLCLLRLDDLLTLYGYLLEAEGYLNGEQKNESRRTQDTQNIGERGSAGDVREPDGAGN